MACMEFLKRSTSSMRRFSELLPRKPESWTLKCAFSWSAPGRRWRMQAGIGIVALKRAADALADGDQIYAIIKGFALNHGDEKARVEAVALAEAMAGIEPGPDDSKRPGGIRELIRVAETLHCAGISEFA